MKLSPVVPAIVVLMILPALAQERDRNQVPDQLKWNLAEIYPDEAAWRAAKDKIAADVPQLKQFQGRLGTKYQATIKRAFAERCISISRGSITATTRRF